MGLYLFVVVTLPIMHLSREPLSDCLKDVDLIPPFNRMLLEVTFGKLYSWAIQNVRTILLDATARFKELGESLAQVRPGHMRSSALP